MQKQLSLKLSVSDAANDECIKQFIAKQHNISFTSIQGFIIIKKSIDARSSVIYINLLLHVFINEPLKKRHPTKFYFLDVANSPKKVAIIGAGPAGIFAALQLLEKGIKPIIIERGKDVRARRRDLATLNKHGIINPESNYCFGEGGAGTYSDGKLYTRSNKRGNIDRILQLFVHFGADEKILYEAHPHIGTNKLPQIITAMRQQIIDCGGQIIFEKKLVDFDVEKNKITQIKTANGDTITADAFILATGHSARDIFELLHKKNIWIEAKPFALGVRVEHPQMLINNCQYKTNANNSLLPPASYSLVQQVNGFGVFSFCMCPGGIIAPATTAFGEMVVNGWSPSKRNNLFANSGMVVQFQMADVINWFNLIGLKADEKDPLIFMQFQQLVEQNCFIAGGGNMVAPAQRLVDFCNKNLSNNLPANSYLPGLHSVQLQDALPSFISNALAQGFVQFGKKMKGYFTNDAVVVGTESRTSSPVRIPRNAESLTHPQLHNLYPCGEGAGYAGGIVSACMDGEKVALQITKMLMLALILWNNF